MILILCVPFRLQAVKKSREKSKQHAKETQSRVDKLKAENEKLRNNIKTVHKNLQTLKDLFIASSNSKKAAIDVDHVQSILKEIDKLETVDSESSSESEEEAESESD